MAKGAVIVGKDDVEKQLPLDQTRKFSVFEPEKITLAIGDRIRFTKNVKHRGQKLVNNELQTVVSIDDGKIIFHKNVRLDPVLELVKKGTQRQIVFQILKGRFNFD